MGTVINSKILDAQKFDDIVYSVRNGLGSAFGADSKFVGDIPIDLLATFTTALQSGTVNVAFVGDSITRRGSPADAVDSIEGTYFATTSALLKDAFPTVSFNFTNFGLAGRTGSMLVSSSYVGLTTPNSSVGFAQSEAAFTVTTGLSYLTHVKDSAPDIVLFACGMNPVVGGPTKIYMEDFNTEIGTWTKSPSVVALPVMFPHTSVARINHFNESAEITRLVSKELGWGVVDINRVQNAIVGGIELKDAIGYGSMSFSDWTVKNGTVTGVSTKTFGADSSVEFKYKTLDSKIEVTFSNVDFAVTGAPTITLRQRPSGDTVGAKSTQPVVMTLLSGGRVQVLSGGHIRVTSSVLTDTNSITFKIELAGNYITTSVNGAVLTGGSPDVGWGNLSYARMEVGFVGGSIGGGVVDSINTYAKLPRELTPYLTQDDIWGIPDGMNTTKLPFGGNGINHPTSIAISRVYTPALKELVRAAQLAYAKG